MKPQHTDHCEHPPGSYRGTTEPVDGRTYDVYVYASIEGPSLCFRFGNRPEDYISPGPSRRALAGGDLPEHYLACLEVAIG
jgi:hypothetical protein